MLARWRGCSTCLSAGDRVAGGDAGLFGVPSNRYATRLRQARGAGADHTRSRFERRVLSVFRGKRGDLVQAIRWDGQPTVLILECPQPRYVGHRQPALRRLPIVESGAIDPMLATKAGSLDASLIAIAASVIFWL